MRERGTRITTSLSAPIFLFRSLFLGNQAGRETGEEWNCLLPLTWRNETATATATSANNVVALTYMRGGKKEMSDNAMRTRPDFLFPMFFFFGKKFINPPSSAATSSVSLISFSDRRRSRWKLVPCRRRRRRTRCGE